MPKVSDEYREARREEIAVAALRALSRKGVSRTSMADIIEESGLSAGAIYSNFRNKQELGVFIAGTIIGQRMDALGAAVEASTGTVTPRRALETMLEFVVEQRLPFEVLVQFWAEATIDPDVHVAVTTTVGAIRAELRHAILPWAAAQAGETDAVADRVSLAMLGLAQGYILRVALFGPTDPGAYLDAIIDVVE